MAWRQTLVRGRPARLAAGRCAVDAVGAQVVVQQPQLLVSAGAGHRLRDGADADHGAGRIRRWSGRVCSELDSPTAAAVSPADGARPARARRSPSTPRSRFGISASSCRKMTRVDSATVALDIVPPPAAALDLRGASTLAQQLSQVGEGAGHTAGRRAQHRSIDRRGEQAAGRQGPRRGRDRRRHHSACTRRLIGDVPLRRASRWRWWKTSCRAGTRPAISR